MDGNGQRPPHPQPPPGLQSNPELMALHNQVRSVVEVFMRGLIVSNNDRSPAMMLSMIAWYTGNYAAGCVNGELTHIFKFREGLRSAFADGITKAPIQGPPPEPQILPPEPPLRP